MQAFARGGKIVCFFKSADKFKARYATLGFEEDARLDDGNMWPTSFALKKLTAADEDRRAREESVSSGPSSPLSPARDATA